MLDINNWHISVWKCRMKTNLQIVVLDPFGSIECLNTCEHWFSCDASSHHHLPIDDGESANYGQCQGCPGLSRSLLQESRIQLCLRTLRYTRQQHRFQNSLQSPPCWFHVEKKKLVVGSSNNHMIQMEKTVEGVISQYACLLGSMRGYKTKKY